MNPQQHQGCRANEDFQGELELLPHRYDHHAGASGHGSVTAKARKR